MVVLLTGGLVTVVVLLTGGVVTVVVVPPAWLCTLEEIQAMIASNPNVVAFP
jgi:hypothetical protein